MIISDENSINNQTQDANSSLSSDPVNVENTAENPGISMLNNSKESVVSESAHWPEQSYQADRIQSASSSVSPEEAVLPDTSLENIATSVSTPSVAVSGGKEHIPSWFLALFGVTVVIFLGVTGFLVSSLTKEKNDGQILIPTQMPIPSSIPSPSVLPTPTPFNPAQDTVIQLLTKQNESDELPAIEADVSETDVSTLEQGIGILDSQVGYSP